MIRRALLVAACLSVTSFAAGTAFASDTTTPTSVDHTLCVGTSNSPSSFDGICVGIPTH